MDNITIIAIIIILILVYLFVTNRTEPFDLTVGMRQYPHLGKFSDCQQIGTRFGLTTDMCKDLCNRMESCVGISYMGPPVNECRLYNDTSHIEYDPRYVSWYVFANKKIY